MDLNKVFRIWAGFSFLFVIITALTNWMNHPDLVGALKGNGVNALFLLIPVMLLACFFRSKVLKVANHWPEFFSVAFLVGVAVPHLFPKVHTYNESYRVMWVYCIASCLYFGSVLGWDQWAERVKKIRFLTKIPTPVYLGLFAVLCIGLWIWGGREGRYVLTFLALAPVLRYWVTKKDPELLKAFALFLGTDVLFANWPPERDLPELWQPLLTCYHLVLSAFIFIYWEKLKASKKLFGKVSLLLFAVLPMIPYFYFGYGNWTWPAQVIILGVLWGWDPWLKPYATQVYLVLGSLLGFCYLFTENNAPTISVAILLLTIGIGQLRQHVLKQPPQLIRTIALFTLAAVAYALYPRYSSFFIERGSWLLACHFLLSALFLLYWEKLRDPKFHRPRIWIYIYALVPCFYAFYEHSLLWPIQVLVLYLWWKSDAMATAKGAKPNFGALWEKFLDLAVVQWIIRSTETVAKKVWKMLVDFSKRPNVRKSAMGLVAAAVLYVIWSFLYNVLTTHIVSFTPRGIITSPNTVIRAKFSSDVSVSGSLDSAFQVDPPLPGTVRLEDSTTLVFTPAAPLKPATTYKVKMTTGALKSKQFFLQGSDSTSFSTEPMEVVSSRLFYTYDLVKGTEKELVGELEFNYPVDLNLLKQNLQVDREGSPLSVELEQGTLPTRFFIKAGGFAREEKEQTLTVTVASALSCIDCGKPLGSKYQKTITLPAKPKMLVEELKLHHEPGSSLISILFSLPASSAQVRNNVSIEPAIPFKVDTEYCYAVLKADFQPNIDYTIHVHEGLRAISGEALEKKYDRTLKLEDIQPYVRFSDRGRLIPLQGGEQVAVKTMNLDNYNIEVEKVFRNNLVDFLKNWRTYTNYYQPHRYRARRAYRNQDDDEGAGESGDIESDDEGNNQTEYEYEGGSTGGLGVHVWSGATTVQGGQINQEAETAIDFSKWHQASYKGLFVVTLNGANNGGRDSRSFLCTDLGLMAKHSGEDLMVQVLSISKLTPLLGVHLKLVSDNNQVIAEKDTDADGRAWFKNIRNNPYNFTPFVLVAENGDDWSYLRMQQNPLNQSRFDIGGDPFTTSGWDGYMTSDRGLYRPGDTAHFTAIVRHADLEIPTDLPVNLTLRDASGSEVGKLTTTLQAYGMATFTFPLREDITTGTLDCELGMANGVHLASTSIKVEEFIPNKIKVEVRPSKKTATAGEQLAFRVAARQLFGAPGVGLKVKAAVQLEPKEFISKKWKGYHFTDNTRQFSGEQLRAPNGTTDAAGFYDVQLPVPISMLPPSMLRAVVYAEVLDTGGRPVGANATIDVHRYPYYLGLKCVEGKEAAPHTKVHIKYAAITSDGEETKVEKQVLLVKRKVWYSIFRRSGWAGRNYDSAYYEQVVDGKEIDVKGKGSYTFTPDKPGEYTIYLGNEQSMRSSIMVVVSGAEEKTENGEETAGLEDPTKLSLILNQPQYQVGETPKVEVRAPFAGRLVLSVEREQVFFTKTVPVVAGLNVVPLPPVEAAYLPNAYVVGLLVREPGESMRNMPMASFGVTPLSLDTSSHEIDFKWQGASDSVKSRQGIDVDLQTGNPGSKVVLAAVDEGILQIIGFSTPDPFKYFYRKRGLTTSTFGIFDEILPDLNRKDAVGGDEGDNFAVRHLNPIAAKRVKSYALFSGILTADATGKVAYHFATDQFHGEVRVMALGVKENKFGASSLHVKVADTVVVEPSFPRFLAPGDHFDVPVLVYNNTKGSQKVKVSVSASGPVAMDGESTQELSLGEEGQKRILFHAKAKMDAGVAKFKVTATDEAGADYDVDTELAVRPGNPLTTSIDFGQLNAGATQVLNVPGGFIPQGQRIRLAVSSSPLLTFLGSLDYLINYPYGCAEQKTSTCFPLLYFKDIGLLTGRFSGNANAVEMYVQDGINDLCKMQLTEGSFALWPGEQESGGEYLSNYVAHFLIEAQKQGYQVDNLVMERIYSRLGAIQVKGKGVGRLDRRKQNVEVPDSAYILYLKALADRADTEAMAAMKAQMQDPKVRTVTDRCFLSLAYSVLGDRATALSLLPKKYLPSGLQRELDGEWFSPDREMALYLLALTEADPQNAEIGNLLIKFGEHMKYGHFGTTQENAWAFMAIAKAVKATTQAYPLSAQWSLKGGTPQVLTGETAVVKDEKLSGQQVDLANNGGRPLYYHVMAEGTKLKSEKESVENGIKVSREYRDEKGSLINLGSIAQGQLVVVTLRIKCAKELDNLVVVDLLPAGFEVDNPRLASRGNLQFDPECTFSPAFRDFRDDRVLLFSKNVEGEVTFSYSVRAVTPGQFQVPGLTAEAMYDPEIFGRSNTGETLIVSPAPY